MIRASRRQVILILSILTHVSKRTKGYRLFDLSTKMELDDSDPLSQMIESAVLPGVFGEKYRGPDPEAVLREYAGLARDPYGAGWFRAEMARLRSGALKDQKRHDDLIRRIRLGVGTRQLHFFAKSLREGNQIYMEWLKRFLFGDVHSPERIEHELKKIRGQDYALTEAKKDRIVAVYNGVFLGAAKAFFDITQMIERPDSPRDLVQAAFVKDVLAILEKAHTAPL